MTTLLAFIVTLGVLIVVHEYGHYKVARLCGVKVLRFSVGFGKTLWRRQNGPDATEFVVAMLPLGGYVKMLDEREGAVSPHELDQAFNRKSLLKRAAIVAAGPAANLLLAVLLYAAVQWIGVEEPKAILSAPVQSSLADQAGMRSGDWVRDVSNDGTDWSSVDSLADLQWRVTQAAMERRPLLMRVSDQEGRGMRQVTLSLDRLASSEVDAEALRKIGIGAPWRAAVVGPMTAGGPAQKAGLREGDRVMSVDGVAVVDAQSLRTQIRASAADAMQWRVDREGQLIAIAVTPREVVEGDLTVGRIDAAIGGPAATVLTRRGLVDGLSHGVARTWEIASTSVRMLGRMLIGEASIKNLSGPLTIADVAGQSAQLGLTTFLTFLALVSVSLGVLNLLPLPMLDGGHLMYYLFEAITGRAVSDAWLERLQRGGIVLLLLLMTVAMSNDVMRYLGL